MGDHLAQGVSGQRDRALKTRPGEGVRAVTNEKKPTKTRASASERLEGQASVAARRCLPRSAARGVVETGSRKSPGWPRELSTPSTTTRSCG